MPPVAIPKRKLGKTGLEVTVLGMGGAPLGGLFQVARSSALTTVQLVFVLTCVPCTAILICLHSTFLFL